LIQLVTDRLVIRDHIIGDLKHYHELLSDDETMEYLLDIKTSSLEESRCSLTRAIDESRRGEFRKEYFWGIFDKNGTFIGEIGYTVISSYLNKEKIVHLGYFIKKEYWNRGYTSEALEEVLKFAYLENNVLKIETGCVVDNKYSERIMVKFGFSREAFKPKHIWNGNRLLDRVEYGLLRDTYLLRDLSQ